jgi:hypothetical protein
MSDNDERNGPGMLTETQRDYLKGELDIESGSQRERTIRSRIRERVYNSLGDLLTLRHNLESRDIEQISERIESDPDLNRNEHEYEESLYANIIPFILNIYYHNLPYLRDGYSEQDMASRMPDYLLTHMRSNHNLQTEQGQADYLMQIFDNCIGISLMHFFTDIGYDVEIYSELTVEIDEKLDSLAENDLKTLDDQTIKKLYYTDKITQEEFYSEAERRDMFAEDLME